MPILERAGYLAVALSDAAAICRLALPQFRECRSGCWMLLVASLFLWGFSRRKSRGGRR